MTQLKTCGDAFPFDLVGWAFGEFLYKISLQDLILPTIIIALLLFFAAIFFLISRRVSNNRHRIGISLALFSCVIAYNTFITIQWDLLNSEFGAFFFIVLILLNNLWWAAAIVLPTCILYPEILDKNLWRITTIAFILTIIFRYSLDFLVLLLPLSSFSGNSHTFGRIDLPWICIMIPVTTGLAFVSYWIIQQILQRMPLVLRLLAKK